MRCYRKAILIGGFLNRTLVVPYRRTEVDLLYDPRILLPLAPLWACYGSNTVMTLQQYREKYGAPLEVGAGVCVSTPETYKPQDPETGSCYFQKDNGKKDVMPLSDDVTYRGNASLYILGHLQATPVSLRRIIEEMNALTGNESAVLLADVEGLMLDLQDPFTASMMPGGGLPFVRRPGCPSSLAPIPHPNFLESAWAFLQASGLHNSQIPASAGDNDTEPASGSASQGTPGFVAVHWRRNDMLQFCTDWQCRLSPNESAQCVGQTMTMMGLKGVFLATDGSTAEVRALYCTVEHCSVHYSTVQDS